MTRARGSALRQDSKSIWRFVLRGERGEAVRKWPIILILMVLGGCAHRCESCQGITSCNIERPDCREIERESRP